MSRQNYVYLYNSYFMFVFFIKRYLEKCSLVHYILIEMYRYSHLYMYETCYILMCFYMKIYTKMLITSPGLWTFKLF